MPLFPCVGPCTRPHLQKSLLGSKVGRARRRGGGRENKYRSPCKSLFFCDGNSLPMEPPTCPLGLAIPSATQLGPPVLACKPSPCICQESEKNPGGRGVDSSSKSPDLSIRGSDLEAPKEVALGTSHVLGKQCVICLFFICNC